MTNEPHPLAMQHRTGPPPSSRKVTVSRSVSCHQKTCSPNIQQKMNRRIPRKVGRGTAQEYGGLFPCRPSNKRHKLCLSCARGGLSWQYGCSGYRLKPQKSQIELGKWSCSRMRLTTFQNSSGDNARAGCGTCRSGDCAKLRKNAALTGKGRPKFLVAIKRPGVSAKQLWDHVPAASKMARRGEITSHPIAVL